MDLGYFDFASWLSCDVSILALVPSARCPAPGAYLRLTPKTQTYALGPRQPAFRTRRLTSSVLALEPPSPGGEPARQGGDNANGVLTTPAPLARP